MTHSELVEAILLAAPDAGARLFKNHSGVARYSTATGKRSTIKYGLGPVGGGGHDLIGWRVSDGRFISIDAKVGRDKLSDAQEKWMRWVIAGGGLSGAARSVDEAVAIIRGEVMPSAG